MQTWQEMVEITAYAYYTFGLYKTKKSENPLNAKPLQTQAWSQLQTLT